MKFRDYFVKQADGSWRPNKLITIKGPTGQMSMPPGQRLRPGLKLMGLDMAQLCEDDAELDDYTVEA